MLEFGIKEIIQKSSENQSNNRYIIKDIQLGSRCSVTRLSPLKLSNFEANTERDSGLGEEEVDVDLPRSLASQVFGKRKTRLLRAINEYREMTMGTYSVDAKDAGKGEREKRFSFFTFPVIPTKIAPIALESLTNLLERA